MTTKRILFTLLFSFVAIVGSAQQPSATNATVDAVRDLEHFKETQIPLWMNDYGNLARFREDNAKLGVPAAQEQRVVFMGDSITQNWQLVKWFPGKPYVNRGISGQTTRQMLLRFRADVLQLQPKVVVIMAGTNDIAGNTGPMTVDEIVGHLTSMAELAKVNGIRVVLSSVTPVSNYTKDPRFYPLRSPQEILALNARIQDYCARSGCVYLDYFSAMVDDKGMLKADLANDGLHPNDRGFAVMSPLAERAIAQALAK